MSLYFNSENERKGMTSDHEGTCLGIKYAPNEKRNKAPISGRAQEYQKISFLCTPSDGLFYLGFSAILSSISQCREATTSKLQYVYDDIRGLESLLSCPLISYLIVSKTERPGSKRKVYM